MLFHVITFTRKDWDGWIQVFEGVATQISSLGREVDQLLLKALILFSMKRAKGTWALKAMVVEHLKDLTLDDILEFSQEHAMDLRESYCIPESHALEVLAEKTAEDQVKDRLESMTLEMAKLKC